MDKYILKDGKKLRCGYTTGSCAAAAAKASVLMLLTEEEIYSIKIITPSGYEFIADIENINISKDSVSCSVKKDGGDDIDVTHGIDIYCKAEKCDIGININGGEGIGRVTKEGLKIKVGEAAINPIPLKMIENNVKEVIESQNYSKGINILIYTPQGKEAAKKTFNEKLGIVGGISILGTSGIVEPMSEKAIVETIKTEINMFRKSKNEILVIAIGNYGKNFLKNIFDFDLDKSVKCSNFIGETIDYACYCGFKKILLIGHAGKLIKLAGGIMNTHSKVADCRMELIAAHSALCGASQNFIKSIMNCITVDEAFKLINKTNIKNNIYSSLCIKIKEHLNYRVKENVNVEFIIFDNNEAIVMKSNDSFELIESIKLFGENL